MLNLGTSSTTVLLVNESSGGTILGMDERKNVQLGDDDEMRKVPFPYFF